MCIRDRFCPVLASNYFCQYHRSAICYLSLHISPFVAFGLYHQFQRLSPLAALYPSCTRFGGCKKRESKRCKNSARVPVLMPPHLFQRNSSIILLYTALCTWFSSTLLSLPYQWHYVYRHGCQPHPITANSFFLGFFLRPIIPFSCLSHCIS